MAFVVSLKAFHKHSSFLHSVAFPLYLTILSYVFPLVHYVVGHLFAGVHAAAISFLAFFRVLKSTRSIGSTRGEVNYTVITLQSVN